MLTGVIVRQRGQPPSTEGGGLLDFPYVQKLIPPPVSPDPAAFDRAVQLPNPLKENDIP